LVPTLLFGINKYSTTLILEYFRVSFVKNAREKVPIVNSLNKLKKYQILNFKIIQKQIIRKNPHKYFQLIFIPLDMFSGGQVFIEPKINLFLMYFKCRD
jgi:hypothetical protein